jgi:hypothetical protein
MTDIRPMSFIIKTTFVYRLKFFQSMIEGVSFREKAFMPVS